MQKVFTSKLLNKIYQKSISVFIISLFIFSSLVSTFSYATAQTNADIGCSGGSTLTYDANGNVSGSGPCTSDTGSNAVANTTTGATSLADGKPTAPSKTFCDDVSGVAATAACYIPYMILKVILEVTAKFAELTASLFDSAVNGYVLNISTLFKDSCDVANAEACTDKEWIYASWSVIRDVTNILTVFSAMYIGVRYIMGSEQLDFRKSLIRIIIAALLINFSFPISKFAIDVSNYVSVSIRSGIPGYITTSDGSGVKSVSKVNGISDIIMYYSGVSTAVNSLANPTGDKAFAGFTSWSSMVLTIVFLACVFVVFLYSALMILLRAIILLTCVVFSPVMFMTSSFKSMEKINQLWRDNFIGQLLFGPVFMIGIWLSVGFLVSANSTSGKVVATIGSATVKLDSSATGPTMMLMLSIMSLFLAVFAANKVSSGLGGAIGGFIGGAAKTVGLGVATGGAGLALRGSVGRAGAALSSSNWIKNKKENGGVLGRSVASGLSLAGDKMANAKVTIGGKSSVSTNEKFTAGKRDFIKDNAADIKLHGLAGEATGAKSADDMKIVQEKLRRKMLNPQDRTSDRDIRRSLGIVNNEDKLATAMRRADNIEELKANNVSNSNTDNYLDAKSRVDTRERRLAQASSLREDKVNSMAEAKSGSEEKLAAINQELREVSESPDGGGVRERALMAQKEKLQEEAAAINDSNAASQILLDKNKARVEAGAQALQDKADSYKDTTGFAEKSVNDFKDDSKNLGAGLADMFRKKKIGDRANMPGGVNDAGPITRS